MIDDTDFRRHLAQIADADSGMWRRDVTADDNPYGNTQEMPRVGFHGDLGGGYIIGYGTEGGTGRTFLWASYTSEGGLRPEGRPVDLRLSSPYSYDPELHVALLMAALRLHQARMTRLPPPAQGI